ncbi:MULTISPECIES: hypothetical protein [unclassified Carboxylicivirga]
MKKISLIATVLFLMVLGMSSCKTTEDCPAYGQADVQMEQTTLHA